MTREFKLIGVDDYNECMRVKKDLDFYQGSHCQHRGSYITLNNFFVRPFMATRTRVGL